MTRVAVNGAAGRPGRVVIEAAGERDDLDVVVGFHVDDVDDIQGSPSTADDVADGFAEHEPQVVIDFTVPESTLALADACVDAGVGMVVRTTGFDSAGWPRSGRRARTCPC